MAGFKGLKQFQTKLDKQLDKNLHAVTVLSGATLIENSPVLLGNFRGSWLGSVLQPRKGNPKSFRGGAGTGASIQSQRETNPGISKGSPPTSFEKSNLAPAMTAKFGQTVYITNNLAYAGELENRHSKQAPNGVLHVSAQEIKAKFKGVK